MNSCTDAFESRYLPDVFGRSISEQGDRMIACEKAEKLVNTCSEAPDRRIREQVGKYQDFHLQSLPAIDVPR
jgi:hypothetical protein